MNYLNDSEENALASLIISRDQLLLSVIKYNLLFTKRESVDNLNDKDKMICTGLYQIDEKNKNSDYTFDDSVYELFEKKVNQKQESRNKEELKREISLKINNIVNDAVDNNDIVALNELLEKLNIK